MTAISFGVRFERKSPALKLWPVRIPLLLFGHRSRIRPEKSKSIENIMEIEIIYSLHLRPVDDLACLVEVL